MKHFVFSMLLTVLGAAALYGQNNDPDDRSEKVQSMRVAFYTQFLDLTPEEAQGFWPVFNSYLDQRENLQKQHKPAANLDGLSDNELEEQLRRHFDLKQRELDLEKETYQKLRKVLPLRKIAKL